MDQHVVACVQDKHFISENVCQPNPTIRYEYFHLIFISENKHEMINNIL